MNGIWEGEKRAVEWVRMLLLLLLVVLLLLLVLFFFFQAEDGIRDRLVTGVQTCALPISVSMRALVSTIRE